MKAIKTEIDICAEGSTVWDVLTDFSSYGEWNPFISAISGDLRRGARLRVRLRPPGLGEAAFRPRVVRLQPGRELSCVGRRMLPGLFDGWHSYRLAPTGSGTRFYHCANLSGLCVPFFGEPGMAALREGFEAMNVALRERAEALAAEKRRHVA